MALFPSPATQAALTAVSQDQDAVSAAQATLTTANTTLAAAQQSQVAAQSAADAATSHLAVDVESLYAAIAADTGITPTLPLPTPTPVS